MAKKRKNNRNKRAKGSTKSKKNTAKRQTFGGYRSAQERKRRIATMMALRLAKPVKGNSMRGREALSPVCRPRIASEEEARRAQAKYLAVYNRFQYWDKKTKRIDLAPHLERDEYGRPLVLLVGRVVDVRYSDYWDGQARVSALCLMEPHVITDEPPFIPAASHIWLFAKSIEIEEGIEGACPDCFIGDMLTVGIEVEVYDSETHKETITRLGASHWTPGVRFFDCYDLNQHRILERRELLTAKVFSIENGRATFALRTELQAQFDLLKECDEYRDQCTMTKII